MSDKVKVEGIFEKGYGLSPKLVMQDEQLSIEAKAIYAYISSFAGNGTSAFPSISRVCKDLNISKNRFLRHRKQLVEQGYINIEKNRKGGQFKNNVYILNHTVASKRNHVVPNYRHGKLPPRQNEATNNNNSFNNNSSLISSSSARENAHSFYEENFGMLSPFVAENITKWINETSNELVIEAMKIALKANKQFNYAEGILKEWIKKNVKTADDVRALENEHKRNKAGNNESNSTFDYDPERDSF